MGIAAFALAAASLPAEAAPGLQFAVDVPLVESAGMPCVSARIGDGPEVLFGIDTGNVNSLVDAKVARSAGLSLTALPPPAPGGFYIAVVPALRIGTLTFEGRRLLAFDFAVNKMPPVIAGTFAYTAFKDRIVQIDYVACRVRISAVLSAPASLPGTSDRFSLITFGKDGPPIVVAQGFELDGKSLTAQVDSMYTGSLVVYGASVPRLGLGGLANAAVASEFFAYTDGGVTMKVAAASSESLHGLELGVGKPRVYFPTPGVHQPDGLFDATVGAALFRGSVLTLDFHDETFSVTRPGA